MLAISPMLKGGYSAFRSTIKPLIVSGNCLRLAFPVEKRFSMPSVRKASILRRKALSETPTSSARSAMEASKSLRTRRMS